MKKPFKSHSKSALIALFTLLSFASCKKNSIADDAKFPLTNLTVAITGKTINQASNSVSIAYDIKNISGTNYTIETYVKNPIKVKVSITTTDGTTYENTLHISNVEAGKTVAMEQVVAHAANKIPDLGKVKAELIY